jgi:hypothetical protein
MSPDSAIATISAGNSCPTRFSRISDVLQLFDPSLDGIENPDSETSQFLGMGDLRPLTWFKPFDNVEPRDGRRPSGGKATTR